MLAFKLFHILTHYQSRKRKNMKLTSILLLLFKNTILGLSCRFSIFPRLNCTFQNSFKNLWTNWGIFRSVSIMPKSNKMLIQHWTQCFSSTTHSILSRAPFCPPSVHYNRGKCATYSEWWGTTSSWKNFLTLSRKMSWSEEKILLIPMSVIFLAEWVSRRSSAPEWEHLKEVCIKEK